MNKNPLDLNGLTMDDIDFNSVRGCMEKYEQTKKEYQDKYGNDWYEHYLVDANDSQYFSDIDWREETINEAIFYGYRPCISGDPQIICDIYKRYWEKLKRIFGPFYKRYVRHKPNDPKVNKALLKDALKSGMWKELPKELQEEYHKMAGK